MSGDKPVPSSFDDTEFFEEKPFQKLSRRLKEEPLVPIGIAATCYALYRAYRSMKVGDSNQVNKMFRARIYAQAFTLLACVGGSMYYKTEREQRKALERALDEKKAQEKRDAWLRELEVRDQEDRDWRERHAAMEMRAKEAEKLGLQQQRGREEVQETQKREVDMDVVRSAGEDGDKDSGKGTGGGVLDAVKQLVRGGK